ncbi:hypothetical protein [Mycobacterium kyorinense]|uniref:Uncharacterized protein n=1 Tax=Mycobacterium kyorinense TaxID=487514 RepID=A0A1X1XN84_9MYCO|nr:hypothetical protein [Mycobacterium kyorinense]ORW00315.1 hypothetical protein AWC14_10790 [Mycobacterium kyorinense]
MTTPTVAFGAAPASCSRSRELNYRLDVVACDVVDVVLSAGGWLFDRAMAGWEVSVLLPAPFDARPLQILGVRTLEWQADLVGGAGLAVGAEAFAADAGIRDAVLKALDHSLTEVTLWGDEWPRGVDRATTAVHHRLSAAARVFKRHALGSAGNSATVGPIETLRSDQNTWLSV